MIPNQLRKGFDDLARSSWESGWIPGRLGTNPSGGVVDVNGFPNTVYVCLGVNGDQGSATAYDAVGVQKVAWTYIRMRRENGKLVIREAAAYASGGGGGATNLNALTDVTLSAPLNGQTLQYNSTSSQWVNVTPTGGGGAINLDALMDVTLTAPAGGQALVYNFSASQWINGLLPWNSINFSGANLTSIPTRLHADLQSIGPNDHHNQAHVLATGTALGGDHTISGAAVGEVLRALSATTAAFDQLQHTDLGNVLPDQHHAQVHNITGTDHTISGAQWNVVGATALNTLGLMTATPAPGAAASILRTDANGGIQLDTNLLYVDGANNWIGVNRTPSGATLDVIASANADHTQRLKMKSGQTGRLWRIEDLSGNELIVLDSVGNLQSGQPGFVSGLTGWQITPTGNAEFNNIWARGELHATVFVKDEVHATGGTLLVATAGVLHDDASISATLIDDDVLVVYSTPAGQGVPLQVVTTSVSFTGTDLHVNWIGNLININDPPSGPGFYFQPGDVIRSKTEVDTGVTDFWLEVNSATQNSGYSTYSVTKRSGTDGTLPKGSAVVSYGKQGDGRILLTSDLNYAPYLDVFTVGPNVWTGAAGSVLPRVRLGRLDGIGLPGVSGVEQYGLIAGKDLSDANTGYLIASNLQFSLYKIDIRLNNGTTDTGLWSADGNLKIGSNIGSAATTGFQVITTGANAGDVIIGNSTGTSNSLYWDQSAGVLLVNGTLTVAGGGGTVDQTYVDTHDSIVQGNAQNYANTAQGNAAIYSDGRRVVGVAGTWTSAANVISWTGLTAVLANGGSRSIASGNSGTMSVRTYLYVDVTVAGTLTMQVTTNAATINQPGYVLIAVCDPGSPKASVSVVAGSTYVSGTNIFAQSILASNIAANSIDTGQLTVTYNNSITTISNNATQGINDASSAQTTASNAGTAAATAQTAATNAQTTANNAITAAANAQVYGDSRRVVGVSGTWGVVDGNTISWSSLQVKFANGAARTITAEPAHNLTTAGRHYLYVDLSGSGTMAMVDVISLTPIGVNNALIAVADTGGVKASISVVAGSTYISGDNILTGSIQSAQIAARTITASNIVSSTITGNEIAAFTINAGHINVVDLQSLSSQTGTLTVSGAMTVGVAGNIHSSGKDTYANATPGFFLGRSGSVYAFDLGNASNYLRWNGSSLALKTSVPLDLTSDVSNAIFNFHSPAGHSASMFFDVGGDQAFTFNAPLVARNFTAQDLLTINYATGLSAGDVLKLSLTGISNPGSDTFRYDRVDVQSQLNYSGNLSCNGSFIAAGPLITAGNRIIITNSSPITDSTHPAGQVGEIRWDNSFIYVWTNNGTWRRATLNIF